MAAERHSCAGFSYHGRIGAMPCGSRNATRHEEGKWWCASHAPSAEAKRKAKREAEYKERRAASDALHDRASDLAQRAGCIVNVHYGFHGRPTDSVVIPADALVRLLHEAGR